MSSNIAAAIIFLMHRKKTYRIINPPTKYIWKQINDIRTIYNFSLIHHFRRSWWCKTRPSTKITVSMHTYALSVNNVSFTKTEVKWHMYWCYKLCVNSPIWLFMVVCFTNNYNDHFYSHLNYLTSRKHNLV